MTDSTPGPRMISVDDHVVEPPDVWTSRLPAKWRDVCPQTAEADGKVVWQFAGKRKTLAELGGRLFADGSGKRDLIDFPERYEHLRPGCYEPAARVADLDAAGIDASLCFPSFPRFCGQEFTEVADRELGLACVRAYNDWMIDEWCAAVPGRLIPMIILPLWDAGLATAEVERCAAKGARAVTFSENPAALGLPSVHDRQRYWDPVFAACAAAGMPVCTHIGSSSKLPYTSDDAPPLVVATLPSNLAASALADWFYSGLFVRYPDLKLCLSEGGSGWIPAIVEPQDRHRVRAHGHGRGGRRRVQPRLGRRAPERAVSRPRVRLLHRRPPRRPLDRGDRDRQRDGGVRLPARRQQLAAHPRAAARADRPPRRRGAGPGAARQRPARVRSGRRRWVRCSASG
jgi:predicted TIM-barrel fold metal-dependent hydrolase